MPSFSKNSQRHLDTCHVDLIAIFTQVIFVRDCTIIEGFRPEHLQEEAFRTGKTLLHFPESNHNIYPSKGCDAMEYFPERPHIHWRDLDGIEDFAHFVMATAETLLAKELITHKLRWGADWDGDGIRVDKDPDETFFDGPHYELFDEHC